MSDLTVNISREIDAPIEKVFDAWLDPVMLSKFMIPAKGMANPQVKCDPRKGGEFEILMQVGDDQIPHTGKYIELDRPNKLAFTWVSPASLPDSVVTLDFSKVDENTTKVNLTHTKFIDETRRSNHESGWGNILTTLDRCLNDQMTSA